MQRSSHISVSSAFSSAIDNLEIFPVIPIFSGQTYVIYPEFEPCNLTNLSCPFYLLFINVIVFQSSFFHLD